MAAEIDFPTAVWWVSPYGAPDRRRAAKAWMARLKDQHRNLPYLDDVSVTWRRRSDGFIGKIASLSSENESGRPIAIEPLDRSTVIYVTAAEMVSGWSRVVQRQCRRCRTPQWGDAVLGRTLGHGCNDLLAAEERHLKRRLVNASEALARYRNKQRRRAAAGQVFDPKGLGSDFLRRVDLAEVALADCQSRMKT